MITKIELINFMAHAHTVIEPASGLTVLVGDNNSGKSALVHALQVLCENRPGEYMVRHGEKECIVRVHTGEGDTVQWRRKNNTVSYTINGREIHRLGRGVPDDLHAILRMPRVEADKESFDIHFGQQKEPIFLLNTSPGKRASFFASSSDTTRLLQMQRLHRQQVNEARHTQDMLTAQEKKYAARIDVLRPVDTLEEPLQTCEREYERIVRQDGHIDQWKQHVQTMHCACNRYAQCARIHSVLQALSQPPAMHAVGPLRHMLGAMTRRHRQLCRFDAVRHACQHLSGPPQLGDTHTLSRSIALMEKSDRALAYSTACSRSARSLQPPPKLHDTHALSVHIAAIERHSRRVVMFTRQVQAADALEAPPVPTDCAAVRMQCVRMKHEYARVDYYTGIVDATTALAPVPSPADTDTLQAFIERMETASRRVAEQEDACAGARRELDRTAATLRRLADRMQVCPTCGQALAPDSFLRGMHGHETYADAGDISCGAASASPGEEDET